MKKIFLAIMLGALIAPVTTQAVGQLTQPIIVKNALRGQVIEEELRLFNSDEVEREFLLLGEGDIENWVKFFTLEGEEEIKEIMVPALANIKARAIITLPDDLPNGDYAGGIAVVLNKESKDPEASELESSEEKQGSVNIGQKIVREMLINVTDQEIILLDAFVTPQKYSIAKDAPLDINLIYSNQGNIALKPEVQLIITKEGSGETVSNAIYPYPEREAPLKPRERRTLPLAWQSAGQGSGKYLAKAVVKSNDKVFYEDTFPFTIKNNNFILASILDYWFWGFGVIIIIGGFFVGRKLLR